MLAPQPIYLLKEPIDIGQGIDTLTKYITNPIH